jgi:hypothetical protein
MKSIVVATAVLAPSFLVGYSGVTYAEVCYNVSGTVTTQNVTQATQIGDIDIDISEMLNPDKVVFEDTGALVGNITDPTYPIELSHSARFPKGNSFVTSGDVAIIDFDNPLEFDSVIGACSWRVTEYITKIAGGTRFFRDATDVDIEAVGSVSYCPDNNINEFMLSGMVCFDDTKP